MSPRPAIDVRATDAPEAGRPAASCPVCAGHQMEPVTASPTLRRCPACGHVIDRPASGANNAVFESDEYVEWRASSPEHRRIADDRIATLDAMGLRTGTALEIGCATGEAVEALAERGWAAYGLDLSDAAIAAGNDRLHRRHVTGADLAVGLSPSAGFPTHYDLVCAFHVVEHVPDLASLGSDLAGLVRPGGHLYVRVPNWESWSRRVTGRHWPDLMPEHVHHFGPASMTAWLRSCGFEPVSVVTEGRAREWLGGARRFLRRSATEASSSELAASPRRLRAVERVEAVARPWFWLERRLGGGSELVVLARRHSPF